MHFWREKKKHFPLSHSSSFLSRGGFFSSFLPWAKLLSAKQWWRIEDELGCCIHVGIGYVQVLCAYYSTLVLFCTEVTWSPGAFPMQQKKNHEGSSITKPQTSPCRFKALFCQFSMIWLHVLYAISYCTTARYGMETGPLDMRPAYFSQNCPQDNGPTTNPSSNITFLHITILTDSLWISLWLLPSMSPCVHHPSRCWLSNRSWRSSWGAF